MSIKVPSDGLDPDALLCDRSPHLLLDHSRVKLFPSETFDPGMWVMARNGHVFEAQNLVRHEARPHMRPGAHSRSPMGCLPCRFIGCSNESGVRAGGRQRRSIVSLPRHEDLRK